MKSNILNINGLMKSKTSSIKEKLIRVTSLKSSVVFMRINKQFLIFAKDIILKVFGLDRFINFYIITKRLLMNILFVDDHDKIEDNSKNQQFPNRILNLNPIDKNKVVNSDSLVHHISSGLIRSLFKPKNGPVSLFKLEKSKSEDNIFIK